MALPRRDCIYFGYFRPSAFAAIRPEMESSNWFSVSRRRSDRLPASGKYRHFGCALLKGKM